MTIAGPVAARLPLSRAECLALLSIGGHGRIATSMRAAPVIIPVTFVMFGDDLVFDPGTAHRVTSAVADRVVAFETDHVGSDGRAEWDVHVTGVARAVGHGNQTPGFRLSSEMMAGWRVVA